MAGFTTSITLKEMINKFPMRKRKKKCQEKEKEDSYQKIRRQGSQRNTCQGLKVLRDQEEQN